MSVTDKIKKVETSHQKTVDVSVTIEENGKTMPVELSFRLEDGRKFTKLGTEENPTWPLLCSDGIYGKDAKLTFDNAKKRRVIAPLTRHDILEVIEAYNLVDPDNAIIVLTEE